MLSFDHWADWLKSKGDELSAEGFLVTYRDARPFGGSNPSFGLDVDNEALVGNISFWQNGLCDYTVIGPTKEEVVEEHMLDANDLTIPRIFARFMSLYGR